MFNTNDEDIIMQIICFFGNIGERGHPETLLSLYQETQIIKYFVANIYDRKHNTKLL